MLESTAAWFMLASSHATYRRPQLLGVRLSVDSVKLSLAAACDVATDLKRQTSRARFASVDFSASALPWCMV